MALDAKKVELKKDETREAKAPPGKKYEDLVLKLKKQYPGEPEKAFATAWSIYNKEHKKAGFVKETYGPQLKRIAQQVEEAVEQMPVEEVDILKKAFDTIAQEAQEAKKNRNWKVYKERLKELKDKIAKFLEEKSEAARIAQQVKIEQPLPETSVENENSPKDLIGSLKTLNDMIIRDVNILKKIENGEELSETEKQIVFSDDPNNLNFEALSKKVDTISKSLNNMFLD